MNNDNEYIIPVSSDYAATWTFIIPSKATTIKEQMAQIQKIYQQLCDSFGDFIIPTTLHYNITNHHSKKLCHGDTNVTTETVEKIHCDDGIKYFDLISELRENSQNSTISKIRFTRKEIKVHLYGFDRYINYIDCVEYQKGDPVNSKKVWDPIDVNITHTKNRRRYDINTKYMFQIKIGILSDIWIKDTKNGMCNKRYLSLFVQKIMDNCQIEAKECDKLKSSDLWTDLDIHEYVDSYDPEHIF